MGCGTWLAAGCLLSAGTCGTGPGGTAAALRERLGSGGDAGGGEEHGAPAPDSSNEAESLSLEQPGACGLSRTSSVFIPQLTRAKRVRPPRLCLRFGPVKLRRCALSPISQFHSRTALRSLPNPPHAPVPSPTAAPHRPVLRDTASIQL